MIRLANSEDCELANTTSKVNGADSQEPPARNKSKCHGRLGAKAGLKGWQLVHTSEENEDEKGLQLSDLVCSGAQQQTLTQPMPQESAWCGRKVAANGAISVAAKINNSEIGKNLFRRNDINRRVIEAFEERIFCF